MTHNLLPWGWTQQSQVIIDTMRIWDEYYAKYLETLRAMQPKYRIITTDRTTPL